MLRIALKNMWTAALCLGIVMCHRIRGDNIVQFAVLGQPASLPCPYHFEDHSSLPELSVQWRSPQNQLLCHYVKHKAFLNCSQGYGLSYSPAQIRLTLERVQDQDYGTHLCSVSKRHEFADSPVRLQRKEEESVTLVPGSGESLSGHCWTFFPSFLVLLL